MRGWALAFVILEAFALVQIGRGWWGPLATEARGRIVSIETTLGIHRAQLEAAIKKGSEDLDAFKHNIESIEHVLAQTKAEVLAAEESRIWIILFGIALVLAVKVLQGAYANTALEQRYSNWLSDRTIKAGVPTSRVVMSLLFVVPVFVASIIRFTALLLLRHALAGNKDWSEQWPDAEPKTDYDVAISAVIVWAVSAPRLGIPEQGEPRTVHRSLKDGEHDIVIRRNVNLP